MSQAQFEKLLQKQSLNQIIEDDLVFSDLKSRMNALWNFLLHTGYLTINHVTQDDSGFFHGEFSIPNKEIMVLYRTLIIRWFGTAHTPSATKITQYLVGGDIVHFKRALGQFLIESVSYFDTQGKTPEQIYHVFVLGLIAHLTDYYFIRSNRESGNGRYDVVMIPKDSTRMGIIFEFKSLPRGANEAALRQAASQALDQIKGNHYMAECQQAGIRTVLQLGIAFSGKQCDVLAEEIQI